MVAVHRNPDLDAVASSVMLNSYLTINGRRTCMAAEGKPSSDAAAALESVGISVDYGECDASNSVLVVLDTASRVQLGGSVRGSPAAIVIIDHHAVRNLSGDVELIDPLSPSTVELVFELISAAGFKPDPRVAQLGLLALVGETGRFLRAGARTLEAAAAMIRLGASYGDALSMLRREEDKSTRMALLKGALRMEAYRHGDDVYCVTEVNSFESLVASKMLELGCTAAFVVSDHDDEVRVIGRSRGIDIASLLQAMGKASGGEGGGHREAAALTVRGASVERVMGLLVRSIKSRGASPMRG